jgi:hypothetical protein
MRGRIKAGVALGLAALAATVIVSAAVAGASASTSHPEPYFTIWKPGTALPKAPPGYQVRALPSQASLKSLRPGQYEAETVLTGSSSRALEMAHADASGQVNLEVVPRGCDEPQLTKDLGPVTTDVAQTYATIRKVGEYFTYAQSQEQSSTLEVGISSTGDYGSYSGDGTMGVDAGTGGSQDYKWISGRQNTRWQTDFEAGSFTQTCADKQGSWTNYLVYNYEWAGGGPYTTHKGGVPATRHCVPEYNGEQWNQYFSTATTFGVGFSVLGFGGSSQTGYSTNAEANFKYRQNGEICGRYGPPGSNPGQDNAAPR